MLATQTDHAILQNVSRETFLRLSEYVSLLLKWNHKINLVGKTTEAELWQRHIEDSLQLMSLIPDGAASLVDLGSGAGLPGLVLAIAKPALVVTLVEQDQRKAAFLTEARHRLALNNVTVIASDIATLAGPYDVVTARALASLDALLAMAQPLMGQGAMAIFPKGETHGAELAQAQQNWAFSYTQHASKTAANAAIFCITNLARNLQKGV